VNWDHETQVNNLWTATPSTPSDVVTLANWAKNNGYKLRASGIMHGWSPITVTTDTVECGTTILVKTSPHLNNMAMVSNANQVKVQTGAQMNDLLMFLESKGYGFYNYPAVGDITVGGALAVDGHGTGIPANGETPSPGSSFGSLSSLIVSFNAVVWDDATNCYIIKTFQKSDPEAAAFFVSLGRSFLTEVTLTVVPDYYINCASKTDITMDELCADSTSGQTVFNLLGQSGRLDITLYVFTDKPWTKIWTMSTTKPVLSRKVIQPYNYIFADNYPPNILQLLDQIGNAAGTWYLAPELGNAFYVGTVLGLTATATANMWGKSKNLLLYYKPNLPHGHEASFAVLTRRDNIQKVLNTFYSFYKALLTQFQQQGKYPLNGALQLRFNSVNGNDLGLSALHSLNDDRNFDVAIWINFVNSVVPNSPDHGEFMTQIQSFLLGTINGPDATVRAEWSKGYAFTTEGPFKNTTVLNNVIPNSFPNEWQATVNTWNKYDPERIFTNPFLDTQFPV
jgi:hypothetical protein